MISALRLRHGISRILLDWSERLGEEFCMTPELQDLFTFLRFPSISTDSRHTADVRACAQWLITKLSGMGLAVELHETARHPIVVARNEHRVDCKTVLIYGHYDVQPVDPLALWQNPPFEPEIREGKIWARGATDNKGQMLAHILGVEKTLREQGELPVNLIFLFEGEEEIGSPNLAPFLREHREALRCDVIAVSDTGMVAAGVPTMGYGLRGIACAEVTLRGPKGDLHSGIYGGAVANPATAIARLVASLHDSNGKILVDGFYDDVRPLEAWERDMWKKIPGVGDALVGMQPGGRRRVLVRPERGWRLETGACKEGEQKIDLAGAATRNTATESNLVFKADIGAAIENENACQNKVSMPQPRTYGQKARFGRRFDESLLVELDLVGFADAKKVGIIDPRFERCRQNPFASGCDDGVPVD